MRSEEMSDPILASLLAAGPFYVGAERYVIATDTGPGHGNTVAQCFPIRCPDDTVISGGQVAARLADALNELMRQNTTSKPE